MLINTSGRLLLFIFLASVISVFGSSNADIDNYIKRGLENCYQFNWKIAEKDFDNIIINYSNDPRGYHYKSSIYLWYYLSSGNESDLDMFLKYSNIAIEKAEEILDTEPLNEEIIYTLGNAYSYRTLGYAKSESYINAIWSSKKSEKYLKKLIELHPANYDAYLGLGLYNFAAAQIPAAFKWALELAGITGDEETGIRYIQISAERGSLSRVEAQYYLSQLLTGVIMDFGKAGEILSSLHKKYPSNILFSYSLAVVYMKMKESDKAEILLKNIIVQNNRKFIKVISFSNFLLGDVYFRSNDFRTALVYYKKFLDGSETSDYKGIASFRMAICYELLGNRESALVYYVKSKTGNKDIEDDIYAARRGEILVKNELSVSERALIMASNKIEYGKFNDGYQELQKLLEAPASQTEKAEILFNISEAAYYLGKYDESLTYALNGAGLKTGEEGWINAFCFYNAARASKYLGREKEMINFVNKAEDSNDWDYQNKLSYLLKSLGRK